MFSKEEGHAMCELAFRLLEAGRSDDARQLIEGILRYSPDNGWAWYAAGKMSFDDRGFVRASEFLEQAVRRGAGVEAEMLWVEALVAAGRRDDARRAATVVLSHADGALRRRVAALNLD